MKPIFLLLSIIYFFKRRKSINKYVESLIIQILDSTNVNGSHSMYTFLQLPIVIQWKTMRHTGPELGDREIDEEIQ